MEAVSRKLSILLQRFQGSMNVKNNRHRQHIRHELDQVRGLVPLLMKNRNGEKWSSEERATLLLQLRALSRLSPYLLPIILPGGIFMLPLIAYWMDRRNKEREPAHK